MSVKFEKLEIYEISEISAKLNVDEQILLNEMRSGEFLREIDNRAFVSSDNLKRFFSPKVLRSTFTRNI